MIRFENVTTDCASSMSFEILSGQSCKLITDSESGERSLLETILAKKKPLDGKVFLFDQDMSLVNEKHYMKLFSKVGVAWKDGGLISNLKVWENVALPTCKRCDEIEGRAIDLFRRLGVEVTKDFLGSLPGPLSMSQKSLIGVVRAMLMEPDLMIYDSIFEGLSPETAERLAALTASFHAEGSLFRIPADKVLRSRGEGLQV